MNLAAMSDADLLVLLLIGSLVAVSLLGWAHRSIMNALILIPQRVARGEVHRLLSGAWVHADLMHLGFNALTLYLFAGRVLGVLGVGQFLLLYLTAAVIAFLPTTLRYMKSPRYSSLGASGAVSAVLFSGILLFPGEQMSLMFLPIMVPGYVFGLLYLAYSAWHSYQAADNINHDAHFYGAAYGALLTYVLEPKAAGKGLDFIIKSLT